MNSLLEFLIQAMPGATVAGVLVVLLRGWITERLKQSIAHEYSESLERYKNALEIRLQALRHDYEVHQLRTSLFFDHQRTAFSELLAKMVEINQEWWRVGYEEDLGFIEPAPYNLVESLKALHFKHQLFLDAESVMALDLLIETYQDSYPFDDGSGELTPSDVQSAFDRSKYLQPRIAGLFQKQIGVISDDRAIRQIALLGAIKIVNQYHFEAIGLPVKGPLKINKQERPNESVMKAEYNFTELIVLLRQFRSYLEKENPFFHDAETKLGKYLGILEPKGSS